MSGDLSMNGAPGVYDFALARGSTSPFVFELVAVADDESETPLSFDDVRLTITALDDTLILRQTLSDLELTADSEGNTITWRPTPAQSRLIPQGPKAKYEVEVWAGDSQEVYLIGTITGVGGNNDD